MHKIDGIAFNLGHAIGLDEEGFRGHYAPVFKKKETLDKAWQVVLSNKNASTDKSVGEAKEVKPKRSTRKTDNEGVYNSTQSEADLH